MAPKATRTTPPTPVRRSCRRVRSTRNAASAAARSPITGRIGGRCYAQLGCDSQGSGPHGEFAASSCGSVDPLARVAGIVVAGAGLDLVDHLVEIVPAELVAHLAPHLAHPARH